MSKLLDLIRPKPRNEEPLSKSYRHNGNDPSPELQAQCLIALMNNALIVKYVHEEGIKPGSGGIAGLWCQLAKEYAAKLKEQ